LAGSALSGTSEDAKTIPDMRHLALFAGLMLATAGCCSKNSETLTQIKPGTSRADVEEALGKASNVASYRGTDYLTYYLDRKGECSIGEYLVRLHDGAVDAIGENSIKGTTEWPPAK
jgi:hypothetical protein